LIPESPFYFALLFGAVFCVVLAIAGGVLTKLSPWYYSLRQPAWKPPDWAFGPIWTTVFICLTIATAYAWDAATADQRILMLWALAINGALNIAWSAIFFVMQKPLLAFIELLAFWLSIMFLIYVFSGSSSFAAKLLLPYILWVTTAGVLNFSIIRLNKANA
jgi:translocator protein